MRDITFQQAFKILKNATAVIWDDSFLCYPSLSDNEDDNNFLNLSVEEDGVIFSARFFEGDNKTPKISASSLFLKDDAGNEVEITLLSTVDAIELMHQP